MPTDEDVPVQENAAVDMDAPDAAKTKVFSFLPHSLTLTVRAEEQDDGSKPIIGEIILTPGQNYVPEELWDKARLRDTGFLKSRLDNGDVKVGYEPDKRDRRYLQSEPSEELIEDLCAKAEEIPGPNDPSYSDEIPDSDTYVDGTKTLAQKRKQGRR